MHLDRRLNGAELGRDLLVERTSDNPVHDLLLTGPALRYTHPDLGLFPRCRGADLAADEKSY